jgi:hypothetical protein
MNSMLVDFSRIEPNTTFIVHGIMLSSWSMWINSKCKGNLLYLFYLKSSNIKIGGVDFFLKKLNILTKSIDY